jgi:hypothetical protein
VEVPLRHSGKHDPSLDGSDDVARILSIVAFNGVCRLVTALARDSALTAEEIHGLHDAMTEPLDNPETQDDEVICCARDTIERVLTNAVASLER